MNHKRASRILHLLPGKPYGGMQRLVAWLAAEQIKQGLDVLVISYTGSQAFSQDLQNRQIPNVVIDNRNPVARIYRLMTFIKNEKSSIIHLHVGLLAVSLACLFAGERDCIGHYHIYPKKDTIKLRFLNSVNRKICKTFIGVSKSVSQSVMDALGVLEKSIYTIYNGIEETTITQPRCGPNTPPKYGMAARLLVEKGVVDFIVVAEKILQIQPKALFFIAGDGPLRTTLELRIREKGLSEQVRLLGLVTRMDFFWQSLDVAIFLSKLEAFGLTILEAMDAGTPVVARLNGTGSDEISLHCFPEYCVPMNDLDLLTSRCIKLTSDTILWQNLSRENKKNIMKYFSIHRMQKDIHSIYQEISIHEKRKNYRPL